MPETLLKLENKFKNEMKSKSILVSAGFSIKGWKPFRVENEVYFYRVKTQTKKINSVDDQ